MGQDGIMIDLHVDGRKQTAQPGRNLLSLCLEKHIYIPHLCHINGEQDPAAACRLCFVEIEGMPAPVTACTTNIEAKMRVRTDTAAVRRLQRSALRLLLSVHHIDCKHCHANRACELQNIARFLRVGLRPNPLAPIDRPREVDRRHPLIDHFPHRCVLCGKCVRVCQNTDDPTHLNFAGRGIDTVIRHYPSATAAEVICAACRRCIDICPVGALLWREADAPSQDPETGLGK